MTLALSLPFIGGISSFISGRKTAPFPAIGTMVMGSFFAAMLLLKSDPISYSWHWLPRLEFGWYIDNIAAILICLVYFISLLVHLFSLHYLKGDPGIHRYFFKLGFFTSSMIGLLAADHLILVFVFWELVGFSSFLLIGFWFKDAEKVHSAKEAFMVNRIADAGLLIGVIMTVVVLDQPLISQMKSGGDFLMVHLAGFGLLIGALGKSAQFPFFGWLPKAMAGPTPVSALIHAATMVAAGVYLLVRVLPFLSPLVLNTAAVLGAVTAFMAAYAALTQFDIKKVLAYSTISQLGYMILGIGVGSYQASLFHLWTHAFFKAGLFLAAGSVIHYLHLSSPGGDGDQDMRKMGGLRKVLPVTFIAFLVCAMALSGLPFFSGFLSKEGILSGAWTWAYHWSDGNILPYLIPDLAFLTALLTPLYIGRQVLLVFFGQPRTKIQPAKGAEPAASRLPLILLALASLWFFSALNPLNARGWWLNTYLFSIDLIEESSAPIAIQTWTLILSITLSILGVVISYYLYKPGSDRVARFYEAQPPQTWYGKLSWHGWHMDALYTRISARYTDVTKFTERFDRKVIDPIIDGLGICSVVLSKLLAIIDREIVDGLVNLVTWISKRIGILFSQIQSPRIQTQIAWMIIALIVIIIWFQY